MQADYGRGLREIIINNKALYRLVDFGYLQIFENATTYTCLLFLSGKASDTFHCTFATHSQSPVELLQNDTFEERDISTLKASAWSLTHSTGAAILQKIERMGKPLPDFVEIAITGVKTGANDVFIFEPIEKTGKCYRVRPEGSAEIVELEASLLFPFWKAEAIKRYYNLPAHKLLLYPYDLRDNKTVLIPEDRMVALYPKCWEYLNKHRQILESRQKGKLKGPYWYGLSFSSALQMFSVPKIVTPTLAPTNSFSLDTDKHLFPQGAGGGCGIVPRKGQSFAYLLGLLNSKLLTFYFQRISSRFQGGWFAYEPRYLNRIPIRPIDFSVSTDKELHNRVVELAERMLTLHKQLRAVRTGHDKNLLQRQIDATDKQIDRLVYELYGLTDEEIRIVEEGVK